MNPDKFKAANDKFDNEFARQHPDFVAWWHKHPHCDPIEKWRVAPRVAWKAKCYRDEFMEAKSVGLT